MANSIDSIKNREKRKELFLESLKKGVSILKASKAANIDYVTIWLWRKKSKDFNNKVLAILESRTQIVENALYINAVKGNVVAQIFWLKNRDKDRWKDKFEHEVTEKKIVVIGRKDKKDDDKKGCKKQQLI